MKNKFSWGGAVLGLAVLFVGVVGLVTNAQDDVGGGFSLEVSPVTLVGEIKPGESKDLDLKIKNNGISSESLQMSLRAFDVDKKTGEVQLKDTEPDNVADWVSFSQPIFTIESGKSITQQVHIELPEEAGFAYSFAVAISRSNPVAAEKGATLQGTVAVFTLISVDKPGAVRKFDVAKFEASSGVYEYLPAELDIAIKNTGNTFVQPFGNVFIKRNSGDSSSIATLRVNEKNGYVLPNRQKTFQTSWNDGFPSYQTVTSADGQLRRELVWDWSKITDFRIGKYTASLVAVYNDGRRDVPVYAETTFWVIPWRAILFILSVIALFVLIIYKLVQHKTRKAVNHALESSKKRKKRKKS